MDDLEEELHELQELHRAIGKRITRLQLKLNEEKLVTVESSPLIPFIQGWINSGKSLTMLSSVTGLSDKTLRGILSGDLEYVKETTADKFLVSLGLPHVYNELYPPEPPPSKYYEE